MKICFISNLYPPFMLGGAEIVVENIANNLVNDGNEVLVITTSPEKEYKEKRDGINIYRVSPFNLYSTYNHQEKPALMKPLWHLLDIWNLSSYSVVKKILKNEKPDIVHIHNFKGLSISVFHAVKDMDIPLVFTAHDGSLICPRANLLRANQEACTDPGKICLLYGRLNRKMIDSYVDWFIAPSNFLINKLKSYNFFTNTRTTKIPLGISIEGQRSEKTYDTIDFSYMGNLSKSKGVHILINAFKNLDYKKARLNIYGKGIDEAEFKENSQSDSRIIFHGFLKGNDLLESYKKANVTVLPSICYDNSPMMVYESLVSGTPVIASNIGGIPELIEDGLNGFLFSPGDQKELTTIFEKIVEDPSKLMKMEKCASDSVVQFSMENHIKKLMEIYNSLISEKKEKT